MAELLNITRGGAPGAPGVFRFSVKYTHIYITHIYTVYIYIYICGLNIWLNSVSSSDYELVLTIVNGIAIAIFNPG